MYAADLATSETPTRSSELCWEDVLAGEKESEHFRKVMDFVKAERVLGKTIYPAQGDIFNALKLTPFALIKVVILGQDPYHGPHQAHGLCFSVRKGVRPPPSLQNIFKEIQQELELPIPAHGCLEYWATQGVLLLNTVLTVEAGQAQSHQGRGWEQFTDRIIREISAHKQRVIFLLWGAHAQKKSALIDANRHVLLTAAHPSPFSVERGFFGCNHFSRTNELLQSWGMDPIDWRLPA